MAHTDETAAGVTQPPKEGRTAGMKEAVRTAGPDLASGAATSWAFVQNHVLPPLRRLGARIGDWLTQAGWGKFTLIALLMLAAAGIITSVMYREGPVVVIEPDDAPPRVQVEVKVGPDGVRIVPPGPRAPKLPVPPALPASPAAPGAPTAPVPPDASAVARAEAAAKGSSISIDENGLRIHSDRNGKSVQVIIDERGVRVEDAAKAPPPTPPHDPAPIIIDRDGSVVIPPDVVGDPELIEQALSSAKREIESIVSDQVNRKVAREVRHQRERGSEWVMSFVMLLILTGVIVKIVLGGKKRAERRAQVATATAAEEGLKRQLVEAQLKMMQAQVEPHFLFNTLASVDYLIETDPSTASKMQKNLIQYLRAALPQMREGSTTLGKEVQLCRSYLEILKFRMEDRMQYSMAVPQGLASAQFPPMMLQSLVENSIKHGLEPKPEGGRITITANIVDGRLRVTVADTGLGFAAASRPGTGVGLANVRERLSALYGGRARLTIEANDPTGTIVTIDVPYTFEADAPFAPAAQPA